MLLLVCYANIYTFVVNYGLCKNVFVHYSHTNFDGYKYLKFQYCFIVTGNTLMFITSSQAATLFPNKIQAEMEVSRSDFITDSE